VEIQAFLDIADDDDVVRDWSRTAGVVAADVVDATAGDEGFGTDDR